MLKVAVASQKGGVGKSTLVITLGAALKAQGLSVLIVDADPQGSATYGMGFTEAQGLAGLAALLAGRLEIQTGSGPWPDLIAGGEATAFHAWQSTEDLRKALMPLAPRYDLCLIDCPPSLSSILIAAIMSADRVFIPVQADPLVLRGLGKLVHLIDSTRLGSGENPGAYPVDVVRSRYRAQLRLTAEADQLLATSERWQVWQTTIPEQVSIAEAAGHGQPIITYSSWSTAARAFENLAVEAIGRWQLKEGR
ncbi:ParA family protein [Leptolyngbya sp. FACHB-261]|uniref:ParA family protein n=1 Tax=Leptolyngbya sp. FACHB-261 TaxID=2692806 RepID=UPI001681DB9C|nr:ParA family protein [Leptolyngbya sp. FACHB-261]MBD2100734.1 ParA family protein [Leptolyngbya sp. FACHB-261]